MAATETTTLVDAGDCGWCRHGQWSHKLGKRGCKDPDCGCAKYEPPKGAPAAAAVLEVEPASPVPGELVDGPDVPGPAECVGEPEPDRPGDAELTPADPEPTRAELVPDLTAQSIELGQAQDALGLVRDALRRAACPIDGVPDVELGGLIDRYTADVAQAMRVMGAESARLRAAEVGQLRGEAEEAQRRADALAGELRSLEAETTAVTAQRDQAVVDLTKLGKELTAARREAKAAVRARGRIRDELDATTRARLRLQEELDEAILTGLSAATAVLYRYAAWQCETCGSRYGKRTEHEHPLTAVDVLVVRRKTSEDPATAGPDTNTKENTTR